MLKIILIAIPIIIVGFLIVVAMQPSDFRITRSATIAAPREVVFAQVNDLHAWDAWSPWAKLDPEAKNSFEGPPSGVGAAMSWSGNNKVGEGRMAITESRLHELIRFKLDFLKPFKASNTAEFGFKPEGDKTLVSWSMSGKNNFMFKAVGLFMNCDKMVGDQFEQGLASLNLAVRTAAKK